MDLHISAPADQPPETARALYLGAEQVFRTSTALDTITPTDARDLFHYRYFGYYRVHAPELFLVATMDEGAEGGAQGGPGSEAQGGPEGGAGSEPGLGSKPGVVTGYICALADTRDHPELRRAAPHIALFEEFYEQYPAHFHLTVAVHLRGRGIGSRLLVALEERLRRTTLAHARTVKDAIPGVHLVTGEDAGSVAFYRRHGYTRAAARYAEADPSGQSEVPLLLMVKQLR